MSTTSTPPTSTATTTARRATLYARLALLGIALYVILDIVAQLLPPHYSPISQAESDLGVGPYGWVMSINFLVRGAIALLVFLALGNGLLARARSRVGEVLLLVWGVCSAILAFAPTDVVAGRHTPHGLVHLLAALVAFVAVAVGEVLMSSRLGNDPRLRAVAQTAMVVAVLVVVAMLVTFVTLPTRIGGLSERIFLALALLWQAIVAWRIQARASGE